MKKYIIGFYDYTVILTYMSLASAVAGILLVLEEHPTAAVLCVVFSGLCDAFDGAVARTKKNRTEDERNFGIQLDSLCDIVSFGIAPALICYHLGANGPVGVCLVGLYALCALIRLAFFNVMEMKRQKTEGGSGTFYRGLPVTSICVILPVVYAVGRSLPGNGLGTMLQWMLGIVAVLFVLDVRVKKIKFDRIIAKMAASKR